MVLAYTLPSRAMYKTRIIVGSSFYVNFPTPPYSDQILKHKCNQNNASRSTREEHQYLQWGPCRIPSFCRRRGSSKYPFELAEDLNTADEDAVESSRNSNRIYTKTSCCRHEDVRASSTCDTHDFGITCPLHEGCQEY